MSVALNITATTDNDGRPVVLLPVKGRARSVVVDTATFKQLMGLGVRLPFVIRDGHPSFHSYVNRNRKYIRVARLIADAGPGQHVSYVDRDRFNLTKTNLILVRGGGAKERDIITPKEVNYQITHKHVPGRITLNSFNFL